MKKNKNPDYKNCGCPRDLVEEYALQTSKTLHCKSPNNICIIACFSFLGIRQYSSGCRRVCLKPVKIESILHAYLGIIQVGLK